MMKNILLTLLLGISCLYANAQSFKSGELKYNVIGENAVEVAGFTAANKNNTHVAIPSSVSNGGKTYTVERIGKFAFSGTSNAPHLTSIVLPNTIKRIVEYAFSQSNINNLKLPIGLERIEDCAFYECRLLTYVYFPPTPLVLGESCFSGCSTLTNQEGYHNRITRTGSYPTKCFQGAPISGLLDSDKLYESFSYKYVRKLYKAMQEWQKKKPFETVDQWRTRVTNQARERKLQQFVSQFKEEYIKVQSAYAKPSFTVTLYDDDYNIYSLEDNKYGVVYVAVPPSEKDVFKAQFSRAKVTPTYCVKDDTLAIAAVTVQIGQKTYRTPDMVEEPASNDLASMELPPLEINLNDNGSSTPVIKTVAYDKALDENIPVAEARATNTFVIAIGNENYQLVPRVSFAENDMEVFCKYCQKTLGVPISNIRKYKDATFGVMLSALNDLKDIAEAYNGDINVLFYYAGHGLPDENSRNAYLLPADADGKQPEVCFPISRLYSELAALHAKSTVIFMDACFSGAQRGEGMLASARGVAIKAKEEKPQGNLVVFSAASGAETAYPYKEKGHGMFTYFLLKKLQETKGVVTLGELSDYITTNVKRQSVVTNRKGQTPTVMVSSSMENNWKELVIK